MITGKELWEMYKESPGGMDKDIWDYFAAKVNQINNEKLEIQRDKADFWRDMYDMRDKSLSDTIKDLLEVGRDVLPLIKDDNVYRALKDSLAAVRAKIAPPEKIENE